jgi:hypothetical protein
MGLAQMQNVTSIPLIISRCKQAPTEVASIIAASLVYFDDPETQNAVDTFIPRDHAKLLREARTAGEHPIH